MTPCRTADSTRPTPCSDPYPDAGLKALRQIACRCEDGWDGNAILLNRMSQGLSTLEYLVVLHSLRDPARPREGRVNYSKRIGPGACLGVDYHCSADGGETFEAHETWEMGLIDHVPTNEESAAARFLCRVGWSAYRIIIDEVMQLLSRIRGAEPCREPQSAAPASRSSFPVCAA